MAYVEGFVAAVPVAGQHAYVEHARTAAAMFLRFGATRLVEGWGDDVPDGKVTDFHRTVERGDDEQVVFSWIEYPDRATRDSAMERLMADPDMAAMELPFDGSRMIFGGFVPIVDDAAPGAAPTGYSDGYLVPVPTAGRDAYHAVAAEASIVFREHGALRVVEAWGDDVPEGTRTDFARAVQLREDETVVFSWVEWPSKEARMAGWDGVMADPRMNDPDRTMPFDGKRMVYGGFVPLLDITA